MDLSVATVAEALTYEFPDLRLATVIRVLRSCVDDYPDADTHFVEQAARARLLLLPRRQGSGASVQGDDVLDVSLHDAELAGEVELTARLMVAANESPHPLSAEDVDRLLGLGEDGQTRSGTVRESDDRP